MMRICEIKICAKSPVVKAYLRNRSSLVTALGAFALLAAASPVALSQVQGGEWEVARSGSAPLKLCLSNAAELAQLEHRGARCTRTVLREAGSTTRISYTCAGGGFGESNLTLVTPRSLRVETQGISANAPFKYKFQARRIGDCPAH
jgi:hypothetical protein